MVIHHTYMARAIELAKRGLYTTDPNPRVGCVIVKDDVIIAEGWHQRAGEGHAEVNALAQAGSQAEGADCYVTLEPCSHHGRTPPCADALIAAKVKCVYIAMKDPNPLVSGNGIQRLRDAGIDVHIDILTTESEKLNPGFIKRMRQGKPFVTSKVAMSLDGRTAMASGESQWITGNDARLDVQKLRARSSAILTGIATILSDDPLLNVRLSEHDGLYPNGQIVRQPLRVIVDSQARLPAEAKILEQTTILHVTAVNHSIVEDEHHLILPAANKRIDLSALMDNLAHRGINEVMVEAGSVLNGALLEAGLIDKLVIYIAPKIMGDMARGAFNLPNLLTLSDSINLHIDDIRAVGQDWRITATPIYNQEI
ncbi:MAG TPA: bifunctional diaminohydroxyphosphoribosylaminopyrimidine deaminase/5-amino-6-(5-phosphoribosylamino)uracil reductase RibD [Methylophaga aminisulfidivorans]|uniref:Riboflavin biosynthesis protein RibD n=1 Tax=Methylophaga aminisulfidivorans TaxID=230105 RepID=A0A7C1W760_9GAMM|nr:bifunctional diaminohydroxyphosphoribosylaminopyrimidine deaminase/5-amino-6-(5-phosphoribosylamino)uracil reductase RibD [Methylophaga aminisulfidivorans]